MIRVMLMVELHGWLTVSETFEDEDLLPQHTLETIMQQVNDIIESNPCGIKMQYANGTAFLHTLFCANHRTAEVDAIIGIYQRIAETASGSYGMIYLRDDEDAVHFNAFLES